MDAITIARVDHVDIRLRPWDWPFATERRPDIDRHFAQRQRERSGIWNGRILLLGEHRVGDDAFCGTCFETDYASFLSWRDWECPDRSVACFFGAAAVRAADGAYLVGEMASHTAGAGAIYFPAGTPEPADVVGGIVDMAANVARELKEETGLDVAALEADPGWVAITDRSFRALVKPMAAPLPAAALRARILAHLSKEAHPELADIRIVRSADDFDPRMPPYVTTFLTDAFARQRC